MPLSTHYNRGEIIQTPIAARFPLLSVLLRALKAVIDLEWLWLIMKTHRSNCCSTFAFVSRAAQLDFGRKCLPDGITTKSTCALDGVKVFEVSHHLSLTMSTAFTTEYAQFQFALISLITTHPYFCR